MGACLAQDTSSVLIAAAWHAALQQATELSAA